MRHLILMCGWTVVCFNNQVEHYLVDKHDSGKFAIKNGMRYPTLLEVSLHVYVVSGAQADQRFDACDSSSAITTTRLTASAPG